MSQSESENELELIDMISTYRTLDGRDVRMLCVDAGGRAPVVALLSDGRVMRYDEYGRRPAYTPLGQNPLDLIKVKPKHVEYRAIRKYVNSEKLYLCDIRYVHPIRPGDFEETAALAAPVGCVKIEYQEGQWDE